MKIHIVKSKILLMVSLIIMYIFISNLLRIFAISIPFFRSELYSSLIMGLTLFGFAALILYSISGKINLNIMSFLGLVIYVLLSFISNNSLINDYTLAFALLFWCVPFCLSTVFLRKKEDLYSICNLVGLLSIFANLIYLVGNFSDVFTVESINSSYYVLFSFPYIFFIKNGLLKKIALILFSFCTLVSGKSTIIIALILIIIAYLFINKKMTLKKLIYYVFASLLFYFIYQVGIQYLGKNFLDELSNLTVEGGNGRYDIYSHLLSIFMNSSITKILFGFGPNACVKIIQLSAHNDFIEVLVDYGLIGLILYINIYIFLIRTLFKIKKTVIFQPMLYSIIIFLCVSLFSNIIFVPRYFIYFTLFWGMIYKYMILDLKYDEENV